MTFFYSDPHFYHKRVIQHCNRPFSSVEQMNAQLIANWNAVVGKDDLVYVCGDVFFCGTTKAKEIMDKLQGIKVLIKGNHDDRSSKMIKIGFVEVFKQLDLIIAGEQVTLCHYPYWPKKLDVFLYKLCNFWKVWKRQKYSALRYPERRPIDKGGFLIHGHTHSKSKVNGKQIHVGCDAWGYSPVPLSAIEAIINQNKN